MTKIDSIFASAIPGVLLQNFPGPLAGILAALDWTAATRPEIARILSAAAASSRTRTRLH
jgi:hypothetical protein